MNNMLGVRVLLLFLFGLLASCNQDLFSEGVEEVHVEYVRKVKGYSLLREPSIPSVNQLVPLPTTFPPLSSVATSTLSPITTNTHTTIDGTDVPVLHNCYFCPPKEAGLALFGIPVVPGVYPPPPSPPFADFPSVTIKNDGSPTVSPPDNSLSEPQDSRDFPITPGSPSPTLLIPSRVSINAPSTALTVRWEVWGSTEESAGEDEAVADYAQSQINTAFPTGTKAASIPMGEEL